MILTALRRLTAASTTRGLLSVMTASVWLALAEVASAQAPNAAPPSAKDYYLQYMLVALCVALGLLAALRPSPRQDPEGGAVGWLGMAMGGGHGPETPGRPGERKKSPHRGVQLLIMSIAGLCCCCIISIVTMNMTKEDLAAMKAGKMDRNGESLTKAAFWISVVSVGLNVLGGLIYAVMLLIAFSSGGGQ
jgi:hypothetical protein